MTDFAGILAILTQGGVEFVLVGGVAAGAHGAARATYDVDIVYRRTDDNIQRLVASLATHNPYPRGAPLGLPFVWDAHTVKSGLNFTLTTTLGDLDLLGEIPGGDYDGLLPRSQQILVLGEKCQCLSLEKLIDVKRAAGRPKDYEAIAELEALLEERDRQSPENASS